MAERSRNDAASSSLSDVGIPTGLNRIKTRRVTPNSADEDSDQFNESPSSGFSTAAAHVKQKIKALSKGHVKFGRSREGILLLLMEIGNWKLMVMLYLGFSTCSIEMRL